MMLLDYVAVDECFHTTTFPTRAGAPARLPPMAVKLKGETARTNPSRGRCSRSIARSPVVVGYTVPRRISL